MKETKLYLLVNSLEEHELKALDDFLKHDKFKNKLIINKLIRHIIESLDSEQPISTELLINKLSSDNSKINRQNLNVYSSKAIEVINTFLIYH